MRLQIWMGGASAVVAAWTACAGSGGAGQPVTRCGAKIVRSELGVSAVTPRVSVPDNAAGWRLMEGEAHTGVNPREFYFTLEAAGRSLPFPKVEVVWPGVRVARVLGAERISDTPSGLVARVTHKRAPTQVCSIISTGSVHMAVQHNWEIRRAGPYREGAWPARQIQAQLNYLFAAREMCRAMGFTATRDPGFRGDIRLYGFETNFPNGHVDHPPHFHIMLGWPGWEGTHAGHFRLDAEGIILKNEVSSGSGNRAYARGEVCRMLDPDGRTGFELIVMEDGKGVVMRRAPGRPEYRIRAAGHAEGAVRAVTAGKRAAGEQAWTTLYSVRAEDDPEAGVLRITVTDPSGGEERETITYDADTGTVLKTELGFGSASRKNQASPRAARPVSSQPR